MQTTQLCFLCPPHPELSIDGDHGEEQHHSQRAPEVRVVSNHLSVVTQWWHWHQHTSNLVIDILYINVQLLPAQKKARQDDVIITGVKVKSNPVSFNAKDHKNRIYRLACALSKQHKVNWTVQKQWHNTTVKPFYCFIPHFLWYKSCSNGACLY